MSAERDDQREPAKHARTTSTTTSVECISPGAASRRRVSWNRSRSDVPILRPDPTPWSVRNASGCLNPPEPLSSHRRNSSDIEKDGLEHRLSDVSLGPSLSFHDMFGHDRRATGFSQPVASSSRLDLISSGDHSRPKRSLSSRKDSLEEEDPELGLAGSHYVDHIPMTKVGRSSDSDAEQEQEQVRDLPYTSSKRLKRRRTDKPYEGGISRRNSVLRIVDGIGSVVKRSSTLRSTAGLVQRVSRRVVPVRPNDSDDESRRPLRLSMHLDVDPESSDESTENPPSDGQTGMPDHRSCPPSPTETIRRSSRRSSMTRTPSAGISVQILPLSHPAGTEPDPLLKGKSLGMFGPQNKLRRALYQALKRPSVHPWSEYLLIILADRQGFICALRYTEAVVLLIIVFHAAVLISQSAPRLHGPRDTSGYFHTWEDTALLAIFVFYTIEAMARIIVTGLISDPDITLAAVPGVIESRKVSQPRVLLERLLSGRKRSNQPRPSGENHLQRAFSALRPSAIVQQQFRSRQQWRSENMEREKQSLHSLGNGRPSLSVGHGRSHNKAKLFNELPFEAALNHQVAMVTSGRPYLRHSWQ